MHFRRLISLWALLALMLGQIALAEHSATHIDHGFSQETVVLHGDHNGDHHQHDQDTDKHECPECVLTQSLQTAFYLLPTVLFSTPKAETFTLTQKSPTISSNRYKAHPPRAPPTTLI